MIKSIFNGFQPTFLYFDLEDYGIVYNTITDAEDNSEYYQLVQCCDDKPCLMDDKPVRFKFTGVMSNNIHPDDLLDIVLTTITDVNQNDYTGCFKLVEAECFNDYLEIPFEDFFFKYVSVKTCKECLPEIIITTPIFTEKPIYAVGEYNGLDVDYVEDTMCNFATHTHLKMMTIRHGVSFCCESDLMELKINLEIIKMDLVDNSQICCPNL